MSDHLTEVRNSRALAGSPADRFVDPTPLTLAAAAGGVPPEIVETLGTLGIVDDRRLAP